MGAGTVCTRFVCHEAQTETGGLVNVITLEGMQAGPSNAALQRGALKDPKLLWLRPMAVSLREKASQEASPEIH